MFLLMAQPPLLRNCASNSFIFSTRKTGAVSFCFWSGRRKVGILLEKEGNGPVSQLNPFSSVSMAFETEGDALVLRPASHLWDSSD
jgi:hypothetical protein